MVIKPLIGQPRFANQQTDYKHTTRWSVAQALGRAQRSWELSPASDRGGVSFQFLLMCNGACGGGPVYHKFGEILVLPGALMGRVGHDTVLKASRSRGGLGSTLWVMRLLPARPGSRPPMLPGASLPR
eukprot:365479-Chlamydomonas_euryale.AAC.11